MSHPAIARVNEKALHPPDLAIDSMDTVTGSHLSLTHRDDVFDHRLRVFRCGAGVDELAAANEVTATGHRTLDQVELLGVVELVELRECTAQPDFTGCGIY